MAGINLDRLGAIRARPALIEYAVRIALMEAMKWRLGGGAPPAENAFAFAAAAAARQELSRSCGGTTQRSDAAGVARTASAAAVRLFNAPLGKRLMTIPQERIVAHAATIGGADVTIRDSSGRLHLIALTTLRRPLEIGALARDVARNTPLVPRDRMSAVRIHMYSLATGKRHESSGWNVSPCTDTLAMARTA